jgi:hypothetical protein
MWIKTLEGHYMTLFRSTEYTQAMSKTINAMEDYTVARHEIVQDYLQMFPVPTNEDMDEVYKEIYELKKKVKALEKRLDKRAE